MRALVLLLLVVIAFLVVVKFYPAATEAKQVDPAGTTGTAERGQPAAESIPSTPASTGAADRYGPEAAGRFLERPGGSAPPQAPFQPQPWKHAPRCYRRRPRPVW